MRANLEFFLGLLTGQYPAYAAQEDFTGPHGAMLRRLQDRGFVSRDPGAHPTPSCPHCGEGVSYRLRDRVLCNQCGSSVDDRHLLLWQLDLDAFLRWLAEELNLSGGVGSLDSQLWQLGTLQSGSVTHECFFWRGGPLAECGHSRLSAYRNVIILYGLSRPSVTEMIRGPVLSLLEILHWHRSLRVADGVDLLRQRGNVRFDSVSGALRVGDIWLGEVPVGSKEFFFLDCLAAQFDRFVPYADLKHDVLRRSGSTDTTEEATFCQGLKSRIKKKWIPQIDRLIATTNKGDGYRLRGHAEL